MSKQLSKSEERAIALMGPFLFYAFFWGFGWAFFVLAITLALYFRTGSATFALTFLALFSLLLKTSTYTRVPDIFIALISAVIATIIFNRSKKPSMGRKRQIYAFGLLILVTSTLMSLFDAIFIKPLPTSETMTVIATPSKRIGLALSGGGYRAALMHAGVLDALSHFQIPISSIASVSGGSITAAFYERGGEPKQLVEAIISGRFNLYRKLIDIQYIPGFAFILPGEFRLRAQASVLDDSFRSQTFAPSGNARVHLMLIATDLETGSAIGITRNGYFTRRLAIPLHPAQLYVNEPSLTSTPEVFHDYLTKNSTWTTTTKDQWPSNVSTSLLIATSGAFPGAFEPMSSPNYDLVDGGVTDNSGMTLLLDADFFARHCETSANTPLQNWTEDLVISSDASQSYNSSDTTFSVIGAAERAIDTAYTRVSLRPIYLEFNISSPPGILLTPNTLLRWEPNTQHNYPNLQLVWTALTLLTENQRRDIASMLTREPDVTDSTRLAAQEFLNIEHEDPEQHLSSLRDALYMYELPEDLDTFYQSPTLSSNYSKVDAHRLYRLGWLLVALNLSAIQNALKSHLPDAQKTPELCPQLR